jgi:dihydrofolate synthase/folylpolyglutamate synthase
LAALGHPERSLPPVIHVAGTNGKGSVVAFLAAIAKAAGLKAHAYISPHLVRFHERIALAGAPIGEDELLAVLEECEAANGGAPITFFEITTAAAFLAFARAPADLAILEVGLGGRFDATNVVARPALTAITPVSIDHIGFLGDTLARIAFEKAGILKPGVRAIVGRQEPAAMAVLEARARELGAPLTVCDRDYRALPIANGFAFRDAAGAIALPRPALAGPHQIDNAAIAVACARALAHPPLGAEAIAAGIASAVWPGRLQRLSAGRLAARLPPGHELWLDGGHNPAAARALVLVLAAWCDAPVRLVFGMMNTRDPREFLAPLAPFVAGLEAVAVPGEVNALPAETLAAAARELGIAAEPAPSLAAALDAAAAQADGERHGRVLVCGSLYLVGHALAENG